MFWLDPGNVSGAEYLQVKDIKFGKTTLEHCQQSLQVTGAENSKASSLSSEGLRVKNVKDVDRNSFYNSLSNLSSKPSVLSVLAGYNEKFVPKASKLDSPEPLDSLYDIDYKPNDYDEICTKAASVFQNIKISATQIGNGENITKHQALSKYWFAFRAGRITASKVKGILQTSTEHPSVSLIKNICYPEAYNFSTCATRWGCKHEKTAS